VREEEEEEKEMTKEGERTEGTRGAKRGNLKKGGYKYGCILLQNNLKVVLQIPTRLFPEPRWYLPVVFNIKLFVAYHRGSRVNRAGIIVLNFKNATPLFLITVPS